MRTWRRWKRILLARRFERELAEEVRFHREMAGGPAFGSVALTMEESRAVWRLAWLDSLAQDVRYALRGFRKAPGFALTVVLTLALGLGTLATSFSVFNGLVLRPFAVKDPYSLYTFLGWGPSKGSYQSRAFNWRTFTDFRQRNGAFSDVLGYRDLSANVDKNPIAAQAVTGNYFTMLGARICLGRPILESDDVPGNEVAVASYAAWKSRLGADPAAVGKRIRLRGLDDRQVELVGVACPEFNGLAESRVDFWLSLPLAIPLGGGQVGADVFGPKEPEAIYGIVGRLKPGMTPEGAEAALVTYGQQIYTTWRYAKDRPRGARLRQTATVYPLNADSVRTFLPVFAAFGLILLVACANVSNMMLARGLARQREIGIRISLGAGRARVVRQLLTEGLLLAMPAALAAFGVAHGSIRAALWLQVNVLHGNRMWTRFLWNDAPDWRVLLFLLAAACAATLVFGLVPALQTVRWRLVEANRGEFSADRRPVRLRSALVVAQVTV
ncbi:MAG: ABC transporter permease, partial [Acidobacteriia bacterium]|nr:ABC transporter permease [Terriglobia bacterium]